MSTVRWGGHRKPSCWGGWDLDGFRSPQCLHLQGADPVEGRETRAGEFRRDSFSDAPHPLVRKERRSAIEDAPGRQGEELQALVSAVKGEELGTRATLHTPLHLVWVGDDVEIFRLPAMGFCHSSRWS